MVKRHIVMLALLAIGLGIISTVQILLVAGLIVEAFALANNIVHEFEWIAAPKGN